MTNFISVSTSAARFQDLSLNPQKLAGQCAKLKCCLNYEVDQYVESLKQMPSRELTLQTMDNEYFFFKADILAHKVTYSTDKHLLANEATITARRAFDIIMMNREGRKPESIHEDGTQVEQKPLDLLEQENINRFDNAKKRKKKGRGGNQKENAPTAVNAEERKGQNEKKQKPNNDKQSNERPIKEAGKELKQNEQKQNDHKADSQQKGEQQRRRKHRSQNNSKNNQTNGNNNQN
jgi:hypothetical protein